MYLEDILKELSRELNLPDLGLDGRGTCSLVIDSELTLEIEESGDKKKVNLFCPLGAVPRNQPRPLFEALLYANLFGGHTGDATFAIDPLSGEILLCRFLELEKTDGQAFMAAMESLVDYASAWKEKLEAENWYEGHERIPESVDRGTMIRP